jgi:GlcNAc-P-P-Und epimerase
MDNSTESNIVITGGSGFIGTNLVEYYLRQGWNVLNIDMKPPRNTHHLSVWHNINILNYEEVLKAIQEFHPKYLLHFAARTDMNEVNDLNTYNANMEGVRNITKAIKTTTTINRAIFASSQLVCRIGYIPKNDEDYCPNTLYGESKVLTEKIIRSTNEMGANWIIIRPTSIWGPWFDVPYKNLFEMIKKGMYVHTAGVNTYKQWGFVLNTVYQVNKLLEAPKELVQEKTFYIADYHPLTLKNFTNMVQKEYKSHRIHSVPYWMLKLAGYTGDGLQYLGWKNPPLSSFRLHNIITSEIQDITPLEYVVGQLPYDVQEGVSITIEWLRENERNVIEERKV